MQPVNAPVEHLQKRRGQLGGTLYLGFLASGFGANAFPRLLRDRPMPETPHYTLFTQQHD